MVLPLLLGLGAVGGGLTILGDRAEQKTEEIIEDSFSFIGVGLVKGFQGFVGAVKKESKGHGVEITATITVGLIMYFYFSQYIK